MTKIIDIFPSDPESRHRRRTRLLPVGAVLAALLTGGFATAYNSRATTSDDVGAKRTTITRSYVDQTPGEATIGAICGATLEVAEEANLDNAARLKLGQECVYAAQLAIESQNPAGNNIVGSTQNVMVSRTTAPLTGVGYTVEATRVKE